MDLNSRNLRNCQQPSQKLGVLLMGALLAACSSDATSEATPMLSEQGAPPATSNANAVAPANGMANPAATGDPAGAGSGAPSAEDVPANVDTGMLNGVPGASAGGAMSPGAAGSGGGAGGTSDGQGVAGTGLGGSPAEEPPRPCPAPALTPGDTTRVLTVANTNRSYILHVPNTYSGDRAVPLIIDFHGFGGSGQGQRNGSSYVAATESDQAILAFPSGLSDGAGPGFNFGPCCVSGVDDVAFARAMVAQIQESACIDEKRVYAVGFSNGGGMSYKLACDAADLFAAVAPAAFDFTVETVDACTPSRPISVIAQRGTNDPVVTFDGAFIGVVPNHPMTNLGAQATFDKWAELDGCTGAPEDIGNNCVTRSECSAGVEITLCTIVGGGHEPGDASVLWPLLREFALP
jgi:polyhydroxybutyrate depolymerase